MLIKSITIEYMDGSVDNFENREVLKLLVPYELMYYYEISYGVRSSIPNWYGKFNVERCCNFKSIFTQL